RDKLHDTKFFTRSTTVAHREALHYFHFSSASAEAEDSTSPGPPAPGIPARRLGFGALYAATSLSHEKRRSERARRYVLARVAPSPNTPGFRAGLIDQHPGNGRLSSSAHARSRLVYALKKDTPRSPLGVPVAKEEKRIIMSKPARCSADASVAAGDRSPVLRRTRKETMVVSRSTQLSCFLGVLLVFLAFVHRGWAIYCWRCNSAYDPNCADPFNNITSDLVNCDMRSREHLPPEKKAVVCRKIVQK
ncbi:hypothetical protein HPB47_022624, partial [Ixodes persulcatus]